MELPYATDDMFSPVELYAQKDDLENFLKEIDYKLYARIIPKGHNYPVSPIYLAVKYQAHKIIKYLIDSGAYEVHEQENSKILTEAVRNRDIYTAKLLLDNGANPDSESEDNIPILHSIYFTDIDMFELLVSYGADIQAEDYSGDTIISDLVRDISMLSGNLNKLYSSSILMNEFVNKYKMLIILMGRSDVFYLVQRYNAISTAEDDGADWLLPLLEMKNQSLNLLAKSTIFRNGGDFDSVAMIDRSGLPTRAG